MQNNHSKDPSDPFNNFLLSSKAGAGSKTYMFNSSMK